MYKASYKKYILKFKYPIRTSRGIMTEKPAYFVKLWEDSNPSVYGIGECSPIKGLSIDDRSDYEEKLDSVCRNIDGYYKNLFIGIPGFPSITFGLESAYFDQKNGGKRIVLKSEFTQGEAGIPINGLIWMEDMSSMKQQIKSKLEVGYKCIKIKIGAAKFDEELRLLADLRKEFSEKDLEIRLDANGAFSIKDSLENLQWLSSFKIHSIEQPIKQGNWVEMANLCRKSPIPIALDEELIGVEKHDMKKQLITQIMPQYIILKPTILGGCIQSDFWVEAADYNKIGWWITSALESNIGLNAIAQWASTKNSLMPQGLGTGQLYTNNIPSPLMIENTKLWYKNGSWDVNGII